MNGSELDVTAMTAGIVSAYVTHNAMSGDKLPELIGSVYAALSKASLHGAEPPKEELKPAVPVKKSVTSEHIVCLEDGRKFKSLKRHLQSHYGLSPDEYRHKWGLPRDYPMVAPAYSAARSHLAKTMGLGQRAVAEANGQLSPAASTVAAAHSEKTAAKRKKPAAKKPRT